tara:strand:+ start:34931 stop:35338 length:408 start_codon:yes stop_codon:yes gene_type:complete
MKILRITDVPGEHSNRLIYGILDSLKCYTLYECSEKEQISLTNPARTVILDNLHQAPNPALLIRQITEANAKIERLILVDQKETQIFTLPDPYLLSRHIVLIDPLRIPKVFSDQRDYYVDTTEAGNALLNLTRAA